MQFITGELGVHLYLLETQSVDLLVEDMDLMIGKVVLFAGWIGPFSATDRCVGFTFLAGSFSSTVTQ